MEIVDAKAQHAKRNAKAAPASEPTASPEKVKAPALAAGQQRSRGRIILANKDDEPCNWLATCGNPGRWSPFRHPKLAKVKGVKASSLTCTTHLRSIARAAGVISDIRSIEKDLVATAAPKVKAKAPSKPRTKVVKPTEVEEAPAE